jgi:septal ring factor EnvC (AmiA/AmiB activator)
MGAVSEAVFSLKPITFHYKKEIDPVGISQLGLVAEDVEKVSPDLVVRDKEGKPYSVRYDQVNAMLLNEFLKVHREVQEHEVTIAKLKSTVAQQQERFQSSLAEQEKQIEALASGLAKVNAQIESTRPDPQLAAKNP